MSQFFHIIFVIVCNIICWGMLIVLVIGVLGFFNVMVSDCKGGSNPNAPNTNSGMPWG